MTVSNVSLSYVETCLSCYVADHRNGDHELLLGVAVDNTSTFAELREGLESEFNSSDWGKDGLEDLTDAQFQAALDDLFAPTAKHMSQLYEPTLEPSDEDSESCYAWFVLTWEVEESES